MERLIKSVLFSAVVLSSLVWLGMLMILAFETVSFFREISIFEFLTGTVWNPLFSQKQFGVLPLVTGTVSVAVIAVLTAVIPGFLIAAYLSEFAPESLRSPLRVLLEVLAGIPTVVYGFLALFWATPVLHKMVPDLSAFNAFTVGIMTGLMILPMLIYFWDTVISSVPAKYRISSLALGADRIQTLFHAVLPTALPGLLSVLLMAIARVIGETMIVVIAGGQQSEFGLHFFSPVQTMTSFIFQASIGDLTPDSMEYRGSFAVAALLVAATMVFGMLSRHLRRVFIRMVGD